MENCKTCARCKIEKNIALFGKNKVLKDGLSSYCKKCFSQIQKEWRIKNSEKSLQIYKNYYYKNREKRKAEANEWNKANPDKHKNNYALWYRENKVKKLAYNKQWSMDNADKCVANVQKRRFTKKKAFPLWANNETIKVIYAYARKITKEKHEVQVDHIVPLQGKNVCGFHVEWNLCLLTPVENKVKGTKLIMENRSSILEDENFKTFYANIK